MCHIILVLSFFDLLPFRSFKTSSWLVWPAAHSLLTPDWHRWKINISAINWNSSEFRERQCKGKGDSSVELHESYFSIFSKRLWQTETLAGWMLPGLAEKAKVSAQSLPFRRNTTNPCSAPLPQSHCHILHQCFSCPKSSQAPVPGTWRPQLPRAHWSYSHLPVLNVFLSKASLQKGHGLGFLFVSDFALPL